MKQILWRLKALLLIGPLLAACSFGFGATEEGVARDAPPTSRPVSVQSRTSINGRLLFIQDGNLYLHSGTRTEQITRDGKTRDPMWAPDGSRIAFVRREESYSDIYLLNASGGLPAQVTFNRGVSDPWTQPFMHEVIWALDPAWSPDGSEIVFVSQLRPATWAGESPPLYEFPLSLYRYPTSLIGQRQPANSDLLLDGGDADLSRPAWTPDGSRIAFVRAPRNPGPRQISVIDVASGAVAPFPGTPDNSYDPAWSPDGRWLAFAATIDGQTDLWAVPGAGGAALRLTTLGRSRSPAWSPDGTQLAFVRVGDDGTDLYVTTLDESGGSLAAGEPVALTTGAHIDANSRLSWGR
jgi:TolB protein